MARLGHRGMKVNCKHWMDCGIKGGGCCRISQYGGRPSYMTCGLCDKQEPITSEGLGDTIAKVTKAVGVKPCGGCNKRRKRLNKLFPYNKKGE